MVSLHVGRGNRRAYLHFFILSLVYLDNAGMTLCFRDNSKNILLV